MRFFLRRFLELVSSKRREKANQQIRETKADDHKNDLCVLTEESVLSQHETRQATHVSRKEAQFGRRSMFKFVFLEELITVLVFCFDGR